MKMNLDPKSLATGALAGLASALMVLAAMSHISASTIFLILAGMPVFIAGLGFGGAASIAALAASFVLLSVTVSPIFALSILSLPQLPAAWLSHLANLARPAKELGGPEDVMAWYPLADMLKHLCGIVAVVLTVTLALSGYGRDTAVAIIAATSKALSEQDPTFASDTGLMGQVAVIYYYLLPLNQALMAVVTIFAAYYFSAIVVRMTTTALRPREDMPSALRMSGDSVYAFGSGMIVLAAGVLGDNNMLTIIGASVVGAFGGGFLLAGLASFHQKTRGKTWRTPALVLAYLTISISGLIFMIAGLFDTRRAIALTPAPKKPKDTNEH
jgi:hypothetical protein